MSRDKKLPMLQMFDGVGLSVLAIKQGKTSWVQLDEDFSERKTDHDIYIKKNTIRCGCDASTDRHRASEDD